MDIEDINSYDKKVFFCAHSHQPQHIILSNGVTIVNPGSVGLQAYVEYDPKIHIMQTGSPHARYAIITFDSDIISVEQISLTYDWEKASVTAKKNGRDDWAKWLYSGREK